MTVAADTRLTGASVLEQEAFDALIAHERDEADVIAAYETFAKDTDSKVVRFLIELIVEDERRHHQVIHQLANTIRAQATFEDINPPSRTSTSTVTATINCSPPRACSSTSSARTAATSRTWRSRWNSPPARSMPSS